MAGRLLGLEGAASLLDALKECPLQVLDLTGNEICGVRSTGTEPFNAYVVRMVCGLIRREGGGLRRLRLKGNHLIGNDTYTNEAVLLLAEANPTPTPAATPTLTPTPTPTPNPNFNPNPNRTPTPGPGDLVDQEHPT